MLKDFGPRLHEYRMQNHMTQEEVATVVGVSAQAVSKWKNSAALPDITLVVPLARLFRVSTDEILGNDTRIADWELNWQAASIDGPQKSLPISENVIKEFPDNLIFLYRRACEEYHCGIASNDNNTRSQQIKTILAC